MLLLWIRTHLNSLQIVRCLSLGVLVHTCDDHAIRLICGGAIRAACRVPPGGYSPGRDLEESPLVMAFPFSLSPEVVGNSLSVHEAGRPTTRFGVYTPFAMADPRFINWRGGEGISLTVSCTPLPSTLVSTQAKKTK